MLRLARIDVVPLDCPLRDRQVVGGWIGVTLNFLPNVGADAALPNILHRLNFDGHSISKSTLTGQMLADRIAGQENA